MLIKISWRISTGQLNFSNVPGKPRAFGPKVKRTLKNFEKYLRFFEENLYWKLTFSQFFTKYVLDFWLPSESIYLWNITPDFYNNCSDFCGRNVPAFLPPPLPTLLLKWSSGTWTHSLDKWTALHICKSKHYLNFYKKQLGSHNRILNITRLQLKQPRHFTIHIIRPEPHYFSSPFEIPFVRKI